MKLRRQEEAEKGHKDVEEGEGVHEMQIGEEGKEQEGRAEKEQEGKTDQEYLEERRMGS